MNTNTQIISNSTGEILQTNEAVDIQIATAKKYPRVIQNCFNEAVALATHNQEIAESCIYCLPPRRGQDGKQVEIKGASVRLAEIFAQSWGNLHICTRIIEAQDGRSVTGEAVVWDLEKNNKIQVQKVRPTVTKTGGIYSYDMRIMNGNAAASVAFRNAIFKIIPKAYIDEAYKKVVQKALGADDGGIVKTILERWQAAIVWFGKFGKTQDDLLFILDKKNQSEIDVKDIETLLGIRNAIKEGSITIDEIFVKNTVETNGKSKAERLAEEI